MRELETLCRISQGSTTTFRSSTWRDSGTGERLGRDWNGDAASIATTSCVPVPTFARGVIIVVAVGGHWRFFVWVLGFEPFTPPHP